MDNAGERHLPPELKSLMMSFLPVSTLHNCLLVNKQWNKLASGDTLWEARFLKDFGDPKFIPEHQLPWIVRYRDFVQTPLWDPDFSDESMHVADDCRTATRGNFGQFGKTVTRNSIDIDRSHILHLHSNKHCYIGFLAADSKVTILKTVSFEEVDIIPKLSQSLGRVAMIDTWLGKTFIKANERANAEVHHRTTDHPTSKEFECEITLKLRINAEKRTVKWDINGRDITESPLPYPAPVFLLYQSTDRNSVITIVGMESVPSNTTG